MCLCVSQGKVLPLWVKTVCKKSRLVKQWFSVAGKLRRQAVTSFQVEQKSCRNDLCGTDLNHLHLRFCHHWYSSICSLRPVMTMTYDLAHKPLKVVPPPFKLFASVFSEIPGVLTGIPGGIVTQSMCGQSNPCLGGEGIVYANAVNSTQDWYTILSTSTEAQDKLSFQHSWLGILPSTHILMLVHGLLAVYTPVHLLGWHYAS